MDSLENKEPDTYLAMWDCNGLEYLTNITEYQRNAIVHALKHTELLAPPVSMNALLLRARYNPQRNYEIYTFSSLILEEDIRWCFENNPQSIVDQIRSVGKMIYSDKLVEETRLIK